MKILQISPQIPVPPTDGGRIGIYGITKHLSLLGHEIDFVTYRKHLDYNISYEELKKICNPHILDIQTDNSIWGALKNLFSEIPYNVYKFRKKETENYILELISKNEYDIVHIDNLHMGWLVDIIKANKNIPVVLRQQNVEMEIMKRYFENSNNVFLKYFAKLQYKKFLSYEPRLCEKFDLVATITENDAKQLKVLNPRIKADVIPGGVEPELLSLEKKDIIPYSIAHIGTLDWYPNFDSVNWFINGILPRIIKNFPTTKLYVYRGQSKLMPAVPKELIDNVIVVDFIEDFWGEILSKEFVVVPLRIGSGIRVKILELLAAGQNIVTTTIGLQGIGVKANSEILVGDTEDEISEIINKYFSGVIDKNKFIKAGKNNIKKKYLWSVIAKRFEDKYKELLIY